MAESSNPRSMEPLLISVAEMRSMLGISKNYAYTILDQGLIESRYIGRRRLVVLESLRAYVAALPREPPP